MMRDLLLRLPVPPEVRDEARAAAWARGHNPSDEELDLCLRQRQRGDAALFHPSSPMIQAASLAGPNFRLLAWMCCILGGAAPGEGLRNWNEGQFCPCIAPFVVSESPGSRFACEKCLTYLMSLGSRG